MFVIVAVLCRCHWRCGSCTHALVVTFAIVATVAFATVAFASVVVAIAVGSVHLYCFLVLHVQSLFCDVGCARAAIELLITVTFVATCGVCFSCAVVTVVTSCSWPHGEKPVSPTQLAFDSSWYQLGVFHFSCHCFSH